MTLVTAYERLIRGRGQEIKEQDAREESPTASIPEKELPTPPSAAAPIAAAKPPETAIKSPAAAVTDFNFTVRGNGRTDEPSPVKASLPVRLGGSHGGVERNGARAGKQNAVRAVGHGIPRAGTRTWYIRRHLHAGYEYYQTRYGSF